LPRDANQQAAVGEPVETTEGLKNVKKGDLLFFGSKASSEKPERLTHVAIYLGNMRFIHASGDVRMNSLNPADSDFSAFREQSLVRATRIIGVGAQTGVRRLSELSYYKRHEP
jgi:cell wall-associated NlpC family hydrolase